MPKRKQLIPAYVVKPCEILKEAVEYKNLSEEQFAKKAGKEVSWVIDLLQGDKPITPEDAQLIEKGFGDNPIPASFWVNLQNNFDFNVKNGSKIL